MKSRTIYGLKSSKKDEKTIVKRINDYLEIHDRTMSKSKNKGMLDARLPHVLKHFYWNLNKSKGTYFEIFSNEDSMGNYYNEKNKDLGWIIKARIDLTHPMYEKEATELFLKEILDVTGFEYFILEEKEND
ncbi:hypothetical protein [Flavobacterium sp. UBA4854]|uniref:hypothetical protein n=1 Tax=Flavobacterium sp. UBA4854 TaxID=1946548 RepID=UPI00257EB349|nr:hypothetical protein [Flavobacterium sp. UBA4854]